MGRPENIPIGGKETTGRPYATCIDLKMVRLRFQDPGPRVGPHGVAIPQSQILSRIATL